MKTLLICLALITSVLPARADSGPVSVELSIGEAPSNGWTVGDHIPLRLRVTYQNGIDITLPELPQAWEAFEVLEQKRLDPVDNQDGTHTLVQEATLILWAPGDYLTPPWTLSYRDAGGQESEITAPSQPVTVVSVLGENDTEKRDLKPQASLPRPPIWPWVLGGLLLAAALCVAAWAVWRRWRRQPALSREWAPVVDPRPAHVIAYDELDRIAALDLPTQGKLKQHYTLLADCMRSYVQRRYQIQALDLTTEELMSAFHRTRIERKNISLFRELLTEADLVKFAKFQPLIEQARAAIAQARHTVDSTRIPETPSPDASGATDTPTESP